MNELNTTGMASLSTKEMKEVDGGVAGTLILIGVGAYRAYRIPPVRKAVNATAKTAWKAGAAWFGYEQATD